MPPKKEGGPKFPAARIKRIMQSDRDVGQVSKPSLAVVSALLEDFLRQLVTAAAANLPGAHRPPGPARPRRSLC